MLRCSDIENNKNILLCSSLQPHSSFFLHCEILYIMIDIQTIKFKTLWMYVFFLITNFIAEVKDTFQPVIVLLTRGHKQANK